MLFRMYRNWPLVGRAITIVMLVVLGLIFVFAGNSDSVYASDLSGNQNEENQWCSYGDGAVKGRLVSADGGSVDQMKVILSGTSGHWWGCTQHVNADGTFEFSRLRAGTYNLKAYDRSAGWRTEPDVEPLVVEAGEMIDLGDVVVETAPEIVEVNGTVVDSNGALATDIDACVSLRKITMNVTAAHLQAADFITWCNYNQGYDYNDWDSKTDWNTHGAWDNYHAGCRGDWGGYNDWRDYDNRYSYQNWFRDEHYQNDHDDWADGHNSYHSNRVRVSNGEFQFDVREGQYEATIYVKQDGPYLAPVGQPPIMINATDGGDNTVTIPVERSATSIIGTFFLPAADETAETSDEPAKRISGLVQAVNVNDGTTVYAKIDRQSAEYQLHLTPGQWRINYRLDGKSYLPFNPETANITAVENQDQTLDFTLHPLDTTISGTVTDSDGDELKQALVLLWPADRADTTAPWMMTKTDCNGEYELRVSSDFAYAVTAADKDADAGVSPTATIVTTAADADSTANIQFLTSTTKLSGRITLPDGSNASHAELAARSSSGQIVGGKTDANGNYTLDLINDVWEVKAGHYNLYKNELNRSARDIQIDLSDTTDATLDIALLAADDEEPVSDPGLTTLPPPVQDEFASNEGWTGGLTDGMTVAIPGSAMPTNNEVSISIEIVDDNMPPATGSQPVGYSYSINAWDSQSGQAFDNDFRSTVALTLPYSQETMQQVSASGSRIVPAYYDEQQQRWIKVNTFSHNATNNQITVETNHFSFWSLVSELVVDPSTLTVHVHLPMVMR